MGYGTLFHSRHCVERGTKVGHEIKAINSVAICISHASSYTQTTLNSTRSTLLKVDCCRNGRQIGNKVEWTVAETGDFVADMVNFVAGFGNKSATS